jgi:hypothetical protein
VTVVCFDSGKLNIAGLRDVVDGNAIFYTLRSLITDFRDDQSIVPKEQRYEARIERFAHYLAQNAEQRKEGTLTLKKRKVTTKEEEDLSIFTGTDIQIKKKLLKHLNYVGGISSDVYSIELEELE